MVDTECVPSDDYGSWANNWGKPEINEIWCKEGGERLYRKSDDYDTLVDEEYDAFYGTDIDDEMAMKLAKKKLRLMSGKR